MRKFFSSYQTEEAEELVVERDEQNVLMLYNDDVNTFDHVIRSLVEICKHELVQAEQIAYIVHTKGKCDVKHGPLPKLEKMCHALLDRKLSASIEQ